VEEEVFRLAVDRASPLTPRVRMLRLRSGRGALPFGFLAGQHVGVRPGPGTASGEAAGIAWRHFSLCSSAQERAFAEIAVLDQGRASHALHQLRPGDAVETTRPAGRFTLEDPRDLGPVFFAAGIGAAPVRGMVRTCLDRGLGKEIDLFLAFSSPPEALFLDDFRSWAARSPRFRFRVRYGNRAPQGRIPPGTDPSWDAARVREQIRRPEERTCYLCLPAGLREQVCELLARAGVPGEHIRSEAW